MKEDALGHVKEDALFYVTNAKKQIDLAYENKDIEKLKKYHDNASLLEDYARRDKVGLEIQNQIAEIRLYDERKMGELLSKTIRKPEEGRPTKASGEVTLKNLKISRNQSANWQLIARWPLENFEGYIKETKEKYKELTTKDAVRLAKRKPSSPLPETEKFSVICASPPFSDMPLEKIKGLKLPIAGDAILFLWTTSTMLKNALAAMSAWDFSYKGHIIWEKEKKATGSYFKNIHELLLLGVKSNKDEQLPATEHKPDSIQHIKKDEFYDIIEKMYPNQKYLTLFARIDRKKWVSWEG